MTGGWVPLLTFKRLKRSVIDKLRLLDNRKLERDALLGHFGHLAPVHEVFIVHHPTAEIRLQGARQRRFRIAHPFTTNTGHKEKQVQSMWPDCASKTISSNLYGRKSHSTKDCEQACKISRRSVAVYRFTWRFNAIITLEWRFQ